MASKANTTEKSMGCLAALLISPFAGCAVMAGLVIAIVFGGAGSMLGWLFGGGAPQGEGNRKVAPQTTPYLWTPTNIPENCFVTPTAVAYTVVPTDRPPLTPEPSAPPTTPDPTSTAETRYYPTPTPCPTPRDRWLPPVPGKMGFMPGYGPRGSPYRSEFTVTQNFGCTDFNLYAWNQACANDTGGRAPWYHTGIDIATLGNPTIHSTIEGTVEFAGWTNGGFGIAVYVRSGEFLVIYPHLSQTLVSVGQSVAWGQPVGIEGTTGASTGNHLHYQIWLNGAVVDATPYLFRQNSVGTNEGYRPIAPSTINEAVFTQFLSECNSPALPEASTVYAGIVANGGDPAVALPFFFHESTCGQFGVANVTKSWGNIRCSPGYQCYNTGNNGSFRRYNTWTEGAVDWVLLMQWYKSDLNLVTVAEIIPVYAPQSDGNNEAAYISGVKKMVDQLRAR
jgi:murein DD-endopeptidase MepM/ murein hydrolase activator NlpD